MKIERLQELKQKLIREPNLAKIWSFYMDHFADFQEFTDLGEPTDSPFLEAVIPQVCEQIFGRKMRISGLLTIYIAEHQFFHSPLFAEGRPGGVIYFEEAKVGMLAVSAEFPPTADVLYSRFSESFRMNVPKGYARKRPKGFKYN
ncbi:hypothetical protein [Synechococcus sp. PCC 7336]|uniref:hypothetical protein n=1 Tax=Synechococcus sp. PCC 7336 TaxID=195250 RepID=UPI0003478B36|nr:hypothetical protein [Synechococcus sp. PCC 7336]